MKRRHSSFDHGQILEHTERSKGGNKELTTTRKHTASSYSSPTEIVSPRSVILRTDTNQYGDAMKGRYERKPRHKTKVDKYDLKTTSTARNKDKAEIHKTRSRKRRKKSGLVLNNEFQAPNAAQDRLTLKANGGLGMFQNGKASSSIQRRGVPDLSFSEMKFLSERREQQTDLKDGRPSKSKKKDKGLPQHISSYFARPLLPKPDPRLKTDSTFSGHSPGNVSAASCTNSPPSKQPVTEFPRPLPSHGLRRHPDTRNDGEMHVAQEHWFSEEQPDVQLCKPRSTAAPNHSKADSAISYYTWSVMPSRWSRSPRDAPKASRGSAAYLGDRLIGSSNNERVHNDSGKQNAARDDEMPSHSTNESSLSQMSLDQYTKCMLLGSNNDLWNRFPSQPSSAEFYTLSDLKHLAHLEKLEADHRKSNTFQEEHRQFRLPLPHESSLGLSEIEAHDLPTLRAQRTSYKSSRDRSNVDPISSIAEAFVPVVDGRTTNRSDQEVRESHRSDDPSRLSHVRLGLASSIETLTLAEPMASFQRPTYPSFESNHYDATSGETSSASLDLSALQKHRCNAMPESRIYHHSPLDTAQQIIHDIEQEERLASWNGRGTDGIVDDKVDVAIAALDEQSMFDEDFNAHNNYDAILAGPHDPVSQLGTDMAPLEEILDEEAGAEHHDRDLLAGPENGGRQLYRPDRKGLAIGLRSERQNLDGCNAVDVSVRRDGEPSFTDFWRPHILY